MEDLIASGSKLKHSEQKTEFSQSPSVPTLYLMQAATEESLSGNRGLNKFQSVFMTKSRALVAVYDDPASAHVTCKTGIDQVILKRKTFLRRMHDALEAHDPINCVVITGEPAVLVGLFQSTHARVADSVIDQTIMNKLQTKINPPAKVNMEFD